MQTFLVDLARLAPAAAGHRAADVTFVRQVGGKADPIAFIKDGTEHGHVRRMGTATQVGMIRYEGISLVNLRDRVVLQDACRAGRKSAHVQRQHHVLRDDFPLGV